jgi:hypothetical protein
MLYQVHLAWAEFELTTLVVIVTDDKGWYTQIFTWQQHGSSIHDKSCDEITGTKAKKGAGVSFMLPWLG